jgi:hypothetical protein
MDSMPPERTISNTIFHPTLPSENNVDSAKYFPPTNFQKVILERPVLTTTIEINSQGE